MGQASHDNCKVSIVALGCRYLKPGSSLSAHCFNPVTWGAGICADSGVAERAWLEGRARQLQGHGGGQQSSYEGLCPPCTQPVPPPVCFSADFVLCNALQFDECCTSCLNGADRDKPQLHLPILTSGYVDKVIKSFGIPPLAPFFIRLCAGVQR